MLSEAGILRDPVFLFDFDGTVSAKELLPEIAKKIGFEAEMARLTYDTISGKMPFNESFRRRVDILKSVPISQVREVVSSIPLNPAVVEFIERNRHRCAIVSGNLDVWVDQIPARFGIPLYSSVAQRDGDILIGIERIIRKAEILANFTARSVVAIGDGHNDAEMIEKADVGIAYGGVHAPASSVLSVCTHAVYSELSLCRLLEQL